MTRQELTIGVRDRLKAHGVDPKTALDPAIAAIIAEIIDALIEAFIDCKKGPAQALADAQFAASTQPHGLVARWQARRIIRQVVNDEEMHQAIGRPILLSLFDQVPKIDGQKMQILFGSDGVIEQ